MYRILRTDPVTVVQIFEREDREGLEEKRGTQRGRRSLKTQRRNRGLGALLRSGAGG